MTYLKSGSIKTLEQMFEETSIQGFFYNKISEDLKGMGKEIQVSVFLNFISIISIVTLTLFT